MTAAPASSTAADVLVRRLHEHGVRIIFGYPGGQLTPLYDALHRDGRIRHVLARDEQAAAFMADGFSRATGRPGVCLAVCGPGVNNAVTPLATAFTDSVPFLCVSGQVPSKGRGLRSGSYHENDQLSLCTTCTKWARRASTPQEILPRVDAAFLAMTTGRPGPALLEVPVDVLRAEATIPDWPFLPAPSLPAEPLPREVAALANLLATWKRPLILAGGGVTSSAAETALRELAERLSAPVFHTAMGKCVLPSSHPLSAGLTWRRATSDLSAMEENISPLFAQADGLLAIGCRFTQLTTGSWTMRPPPSLAQIDIDAAEIGRHYSVAVGVCADARLTLGALLREMPASRREPWVALSPPLETWRLAGFDLVPIIRRALPPNGIVVADITRLAYIMMVEYPIEQPRTFLHPAGYVSMGYGIPAALGARAAFPERPIVAIAGDGCFLMSGMELATAVQERLPIVIVLINDSSLTLIKAIQERRYEKRFLGVDLHNPDFGLFARAFSVEHRAVDNDADFETALHEALGRNQTTLIEVRLPT